MRRKDKSGSLELMSFEIFFLLLTVKSRNIFIPVFVHILKNGTLFEQSQHHIYLRIQPPHLHIFDNLKDSETVNIVHLMEYQLILD